MSTVTITYCKPCGYAARATRAAEALRAELNVEAQLVAGHGGVFNVAVDDTVVEQKTKHHFPAAEDVVAAVRAALPARGRRDSNRVPASGRKRMPR